MIRECKESNKEERSSEATEGVERSSARKKKKKSEIFTSCPKVSANF